jgi:hypothetical protein
MRALNEHANEAHLHEAGYFGKVLGANAPLFQKHKTHETQHWGFSCTGQGRPEGAGAPLSKKAKIREHQKSV